MNIKQYLSKASKGQIRSHNIFYEGGPGSGIQGHTTNHPPEYINKLSNVAMDAVGEIGEVDASGTSTGACRKISQAIMQKLQNLGYTKRMIPTEVDLYGGNSISHGMLYLPDDGLIIDTQDWQFTDNNYDTPNRKVVFTEDEYENLGFTINDNRMIQAEELQ